MQDRVKAVREGHTLLGGAWEVFENAIFHHAGVVTSDDMMRIIRDQSKRAVTVECGCKTAEQDGAWSIEFCADHGGSASQVAELASEVVALRAELGEATAAVSVGKDSEIDGAT